MHADLELQIDLDPEAAVRTAVEQGIFARLDAESDITLPFLAGGDLCMLGGHRSPFFWEPLAARWRSLPSADRKKWMQGRAERLAEDGQLTELVPGGSGRPGACYAVSPELGIVLAALDRPTWVITSGFSSRVAPAALFAVGDEAQPVRGLVMAFAVRLPAWGDKPAGPRYVADVFAHTLTTTARAAELLAGWVIKPAPAHGHFRKQPPRRVALFRPGGGDTPAAELSVLGNGTTAQVTGTAATVELDAETLQAALLNLFAQGTQTA
jgi:hypothetical protein